MKIASRKLWILGLALILALVVTIAACGGDDGMSPEAGIIGTWELVEEEGEPVLFEETWTFTSSTFTVITSVIDCTAESDYTFDDGTLTVTITAFTGPECVDFPTGEVFVFLATVSGDMLTVVATFGDGTEFVLRRVT